MKKLNSKNEEVSVEITDIMGKPVLELEGLKDTMRYVDVGLRLEQKLYPGFPNASDKTMGIQGTFVKCGYDLSRTNTTIDNPTWDSLARLLNEHLEGPLKIGLRGPIPQKEVEGEHSAQQ
jgi:hypothetical protein